MIKASVNESGTPVKKPYAKPEIVYQEPLEAIAGVCSGGTGKTVNICSGTINS